MNKTMITLWTAGLLSLFSSCNWGGKDKSKDTPICGGPGIGIDTATVAKLDIYDALDSIEADTIANDEPAPNDKQHNTHYIIQRVKSFYELKDDQQCCSENYLRLRALAEKVAKSAGKDLTEDADLVYNHWTLASDDDENLKDWNFEVLEVDNVTMNRAEVLVEIKLHYETKMKLHLVFERGDWYVDNFDMVSQVSFDAGVQVYEEHGVYYKEREMMTEYIKEKLEE